MVGNWGDSPNFVVRLGGSPLSWKADYRQDSSEETVGKLRDMGITLAIIHFYSGFGLRAEQEPIADAKRLAALLHKHGIRVGVYVGSTIFYETFLTEMPEARDWLVPDYQGQPVIYGMFSRQSFRRRVYFMHPGYREYMKRVLRIAVEELGADLIHFDNTSLQARGPIFSHPMAVQNFRDYLRHKYAPEDLRRRIGFSDVSYVMPPDLGAPVSLINDPIAQEWTEFRCRQLAAYYQEMARYIRSINAGVAIDNNPYFGMSGWNTVWDEGVDYPTLLRSVDVVWTEEGNRAGVDAEGVLVSKIRTYKMADSLGKSIFTVTAGAGGSRLQMAESMAFNRQSMGMVGSIHEALRLTPGELSYIQFFRKNVGYFRDVSHVADVAVLHSHSSMGLDNDLPWQSTCLLEQALIQAHVPFDIIFDDGLGRLDKYRVLALADQECLSEREIAQIAGFVNRGGGLVATEDSSLLDEWRQRRADYGLRSLFGQRVPPPSGIDAEEPAAPAKGVVQNEKGLGRVAYVSAIVPSVPKPPGVPMASKYWQLPLNAAELVEQVRWAARGPLSIEVEGPSTLVAELTRQADGALAVHLLNFDAAKSPAVRHVGVTVTDEGRRVVSEITVLSPDRAEERVGFAAAGGLVKFTVPEVETYDLVLIRFK